MPTTTNNNIPKHCFLRISIAGVLQKQTVVVKLFPEDCPKTCSNFVTLCSSEETTSRKFPSASYRGCEFHRIVPNFVVQGGDFERFDGTGGYSPLSQDKAPGGKFDDENLTLKHDRPGIVSMANAGKDSNKSQFFITLQATPHLDRKHVVFGRVIAGMETVRRMVSVERDGDRPVSLQRVVIQDCGTGMGDNDVHTHGGGVDGSDVIHGNQGKRQHSNKKKKKKRTKKHRKHSRRHHDSSSSSIDDNSLSSDEGGYRAKGRKRSRETESGYSSSSSSSSNNNDDSSYEKRKKKKRRHRKDYRHKEKKKRNRDRSFR